MRKSLQIDSDSYLDVILDSNNKLNIVFKTRSDINKTAVLAAKLEKEDIMTYISNILAVKAEMEKIERLNNKR